MTIAELLTASRVAHKRYQSIHNESKNADDAGMTTAITQARDLRQQAHDADPSHLDPAWKIDAMTPWHVNANRGIPHDELMQFYAIYLL